MDFGILSIYIREDAFILIPVLYFMGIFLRQTPNIPKWSHAWIEVTFAIVACLLYYGFEIQSVVQGILVTGAAIIFRDLIHNTIFGIYDDRKGKKSDLNRDEHSPDQEDSNK